MTDDAGMAEKIIDIMDICEASGNSHLLWFRKLLDKHFLGIIAHATYRISAGKIEGINQKIKTLRRHGYGYLDDEYFFLKLFDMSRQGYVRNVPSHRFNEPKLCQTPSIVFMSPSVLKRFCPIHLEYYSYVSDLFPWKEIKQSH